MATVDQHGSVAWLSPRFGPVALQVAMQLARVTLAAVFLIHLLLIARFTLTGTGRLEELLADLAAERVDRVQIGEKSDFTATPPIPFDADDTIWVRWHSTDGIWRAFSTSSQSMPADDPDFETNADIQLLGGRDPVVNKIASELSTRTRLEFASETAFSRWSGYAFLAWGVLLATLIAGPQPRWAMKWAWFWITLVPLHIGSIALLAAEAPWSMRASRRPEPLAPRLQRRGLAGDNRTTGGRGCLISWLLGPLAIGVVTWTLMTALGLHMW